MASAARMCADHFGQLLRWRIEIKAVLFGRRGEENGGNRHGWDDGGLRFDRRCDDRVGIGRTVNEGIARLRVPEALGSTLEPEEPLELSPPTMLHKIGVG